MARHAADADAETLHLPTEDATEEMLMSTVMDVLRRCVEARDVGPVAELLAEDVRLFGSLAGKPYEGKQAVLAVLTMLLEVLDDLAYVAEYDSAVGLVLLTTATIGGRRADGVQVLRFDDDGRISEFRDFIRPLSAANALLAAAETYLVEHS
jgi:hypothetical protein